MNKKTITTLITAALVLGSAAAYSALPPSKEAEVLATRTAEPTPDITNDIVLSGSYTGLYLLDKNGTPEDPIVVWGNGATLQSVLITGSYIIWKDTTVTGADGFGIRVKGANNQIINNTVYDTCRSNWDGTKCKQGGSWNSAIRAADATNILIQGNTVYQSCGEGISILRSSFVEVKDNIVFDVYSVNIYPDQSDNVTITGNLVYSTGDTRYYKDGKVARGFLIGAEAYDGHEFSVSLILVMDNYFKNVRGVGYYSEQAGTPSYVVIKSNTFEGVPAPLVNLPSWATVSLNVTAVPGGITPTVTSTPTATRTAVLTVTPTRTPVPTITRTPTPAVVPTVCETAISEHFWFMGCTR